MYGMPYLEVTMGQLLDLLVQSAVSGEGKPSYLKNSLNYERKKKIKDLYINAVCHH